MVLVRVLVFLTLVVHLCAQTDWSCNHYGSFPTDACLYFGGGYSFEFECNATGSMMQNVYVNETCSGSIVFSQPVNSSDDYQCDQSGPCDSVGIAVYNDSICTDYIGGVAFVIGECISDNGTSYMFECTDTDIVQEYFYLSENCTGPSVTFEIDPSNFVDAYGQCYELTCNSSYTPAPTSSPIEDGTIGPYDCNVGIYDIWPLVAGECSYDTTDDGDVESFMIECADDGDSATLYKYNGTDCTGDMINETDVEYFYCGSSSDCTMTTISGSIYYGSNCSGNTTGSAQFNLAQIDDCISMYNGFVSFSYFINDDYVYISNYYGNGICSGYSQFNLTLMDGCNQIDVNESVDVTFDSSTRSQSTMTPYSTGDSDSADTTEESADSSDSPDSTMTTTNGDDDDDDDDNSSPASKIAISNVKQIFAFIIAIVVYKL